MDTERYQRYEAISEQKLRRPSNDAAWVHNTMVEDLSFFSDEAQLIINCSKMQTSIGWEVNTAAYLTQSPRIHPRKSNETNYWDVMFGPNNFFSKSSKATWRGVPNIISVQRSDEYLGWILESVHFSFAIELNYLIPYYWLLMIWIPHDRATIFEALLDKRTLYWRMLWDTCFLRNIVYRIPIKHSTIW